MRWLFTLVVACVAGCSSKSEGGGDGSGSAAVTVDAAAPKLPEGPTAHPDSAAGLVAQVDALVAASESGDAARLAAHARALVLVEPDQWFSTRFTKKRVAARLFEEYQPLAAAMSQLAGTIARQKEAGLGEIVVEKYEKTDDLKAVGYQSRALRMMVTATPLYSVRMKSEDNMRSFHIWSFVHQDGQFRFIGKMKKLTRPKMLGDLDLNEFSPVDATRLQNAAAAPDQQPDAGPPP